MGVVTPSGISVVIPVYGDTPTLNAVIERVDAELTSLDCPGEIVIVDDASPVAVRIPRTASRMRVIRNDRNLGFGATANRGVLESEHEAVLLLNSDMFLRAGALQALAGELGEGDFAVSPRITIRDDDGPCESVAYVYLRRGSLNVGHLGMRQGELVPAEPVDIAYCCGGAMLAWRDRFEQLGGFSALFSPYYWEDADLGMRAWRVGLRSRFVPTAHAVHMHGQTIGRSDPNAVAAIMQAHRLLWTVATLDDVSTWTRYLCWGALRFPYDLVRGRLSVRALVAAVGKASEVRAHAASRRSCERALGRTMTVGTVLRQFAPIARRGRWGRL